MFKGSWKTTITGALILIGALASAGIALLDGNPATNVNFEEVFAALSGIGLIAARDDNKTSEKVKAK